LHKSEFLLRTRLLRKLSTTDCGGLAELQPVCAVLAALDLHSLKRWFA
jgi:hypothetical protein